MVSASLIGLGYMSRIPGFDIALSAFGSGSAPYVVRFSPEAQGKIPYPEAAFQAGIQGQEVFVLQIDPAGRVTDYRVEKSFHPLLRIACEEALPALQFSPSKSARELKWVADFQIPSYGK